ncbi:hypothetical protein L226DRAFT_522075 [Lentinus tigrinus ALCF2SS1-7]|uniref:Uncharacterized protein n=1 Tax=Lentinus tigrinus ALCF2SS1-6 TaxID=1328759 RepID=A0A5C2SKA0_9APHY|nr:hypothetical protein L227DRAFT_560994 [Lentinus tigrinus ALCF2SS1-6]RPD76494.1 hypothetical protein L226DRAFT_522075 [Lentinus tigrinus ALCF2SS1-7]
MASSSSLCDAQTDFTDTTIQQSTWQMYDLLCTPAAPVAAQSNAIASSSSHPTSQMYFSYPAQPVRLHFVCMLTGKVSELTLLQTTTKTGKDIELFRRLPEYIPPSDDFLLHIKCQQKQGILQHQYESLVHNMLVKELSNVLIRAQEVGYPWVYAAMDNPDDTLML